MADAPDALTHSDAFSHCGSMHARAHGKQLHRENASGCVSASDDDTDIEPDEREAIQTETELATRQSIDQAAVVSGLMRAARWPR